MKRKRLEPDLGGGECLTKRQIWATPPRSAGGAPRPAPKGERSPRTTPSNHGLVGCVARKFVPEGCLDDSAFTQSLRQPSVIASA